VRLANLAAVGLAGAVLFFGVAEGEEERGELLADGFGDLAVSAIAASVKERVRETWRWGGREDVRRGGVPKGQDSLDGRLL
jgi:hypothetical protein